MDDDGPPLSFLTASLHVDYLRPTPMDEPIELRGTIKEIRGRKVVIEISVSVDEQLTARGEVVAVQVADHWSSTVGDE